MAAESGSLISILFGGAIGFASAIFAEPIRRWIYSPKLLLSFENNTDHKARTPEHATLRNSKVSAVPIQSTHEAEYVRIKVKNPSKSLAKQCRAYLVAIDRKNSDGSFKSTFYCDSIPLAWSCRDDHPYEPIDLPNGVHQFIDLISVRSISNEYKLEISPLPHRYLGFLRDKGTYRFTIQVSGENVVPTFIRIQFTWNGIWDQYDAKFDSTYS